MKNKASILFAVLVLILATLACNLFNTEMSLENFRTAYDSDGRNVTTVFGPGDVFYAVADLNNAPAGTLVEVKWIVVNIEGVNPGEVIYEQSMNDFTDNSFTGTIYFELSNEDGWPAGDYKVDIYLNSAPVDSAAFSVR